MLRRGLSDAIFGRLGAMAEIHRLRLGEMLVQAGVIDEHQLSSALADQSRRGRPMGTTLVEMGFLGETELLPALAHQLGVPMARLDGKRLRSRRSRCQRHHDDIEAVHASPRRAM